MYGATKPIIASITLDNLKLRTIRNIADVSKKYGNNRVTLANLMTKYIIITDANPLGMGQYLKKGNLETSTPNKIPRISEGKK
jgi:hypothetical protein